jgi:hypothetical protein
MKRHNWFLFVVFVFVGFCNVYAGTLKITLTGDDAALFKIGIVADVVSGRDVQKSPASWGVRFHEKNEIRIVAFIDSNGNDHCDEPEIQCGTFTEISGDDEEKSVALKLSKIIIKTSFLGDKAKYRNPMYVYNAIGRGSSSKIASKIESDKIITYGIIPSQYGADGNLQVFDDIDCNGRFDEYDPIISESMIEWKYQKNADVSIKIKPYEAKNDSQVRILYKNNAGYYKDDLVHYRIISPCENVYLLLIPIGKGTDGADYDCYECRYGNSFSWFHSGDHFWGLIKEARIPFAYNDWCDQNDDWVSDIHLLIAYLETKKGCVVYGKELLPTVKQEASP